MFSCSANQTVNLDSQLQLYFVILWNHFDPVIFITEQSSRIWKLGHLGLGNEKITNFP